MARKKRKTRGKTKAEGGDTKPTVDLTKTDRNARRNIAAEINAATKTAVDKQWDRMDYAQRHALLTEHREAQQAIESAKALDTAKTLLEEEASELREVNEQLEEQLTDLKDIRDRFDARLASDTKDLLDEARTEGVDLGKKEASKNHGERKKELDAARAELASHSEQLLELGGLRVKAEQLTAVEAELAETEKQLKNATRRFTMNDKASAERDKLRDELAEAKQTFSAKEIECVGHLQNLADTEEKLKDAEADLEKAAKKVAQLTEQAEASMAKVNDQLLADQQETVDRLVAEIEVLKGQIQKPNKFRAENTKLKNDLSTAERKVREAENELQTAEARLDRLEKTSSANSSDLEKLKKAHRRLKMAFKGRKDAIDSQARELEELKS